MAVCLGLEMDAVSSLCVDAAQGEVVAPANFNGGGQIVIAGAKTAVARAMLLAKERGAKRVVGSARQRAISLSTDAAGGGRIEHVLDECDRSVRLPSELSPTSKPKSILMPTE